MDKSGIIIFSAVIKQFPDPMDVDLPKIADIISKNYLE